MAESILRRTASVTGVMTPRARESLSVSGLEVGWKWYLISPVLLLHSYAVASEKFQ